MAGWLRGAAATTTLGAVRRPVEAAAIVNEDASAWAAACVVVVWLWCLAAFVPALLAARWRRFA